MSDSLLSVEDLAVEFDTYGGIVKAVRGVSFAVDTGETLEDPGPVGDGDPGPVVEEANDRLRRRTGPEGDGDRERAHLLHRIGDQIGNGRF